jgi:hypothetical protein
MIEPTSLLPGILSQVVALVLATGGAGLDGQPVDDIAHDVDPGGLWIEHEHLPSFVIPEDEQLNFDVVLNLGVASPTVGQFVLSAGVEEYTPPLVGGAETHVGEGGRTAWMRGRAHGAHQAYTLDHVIETRILPQQEWPRVVYREVQTGSENRKRELKYGHKEDKAWAWFRKDHHCYGCGRDEHHVKEKKWFRKVRVHCEGCRRMGHRDWHDASEFEIPTGSLDMLSSVYAARTMVREGIQAMNISMLDREKRWDVALTRGERKRIATPAGSFDCVAIKLDPRPPEGSDQKRRFEGRFGVHGSLSIWLEENSGIPVRLEGVVPLGGVVSLDVHIELTEYKGTPRVFTPK